MVTEEEEAKKKTPRLTSKHRTTLLLWTDSFEVYWQAAAARVAVELSSIPRGDRDASRQHKQQVNWQRGRHPISTIVGHTLH